jgi:hypothetical protein
LAEQIGENYWHEEGSIGHNLRTVVVDPSGHIRQIIPGNKWTVAQFVQDIVQAEGASHLLEGSASQNHKDVPALQGPASQRR